MAPSQVVLNLNIIRHSVLEIKGKYKFIWLLRSRHSRGIKRNVNGAYFGDRSLSELISTRFLYDCKLYYSFSSCVKYEYNTTFRSWVIRENVNSDDFFCVSRIQSWQKVVGTLSTLCEKCVHIFSLNSKQGSSFSTFNKTLFVMCSLPLPPSFNVGTPWQAPEVTRVDQHCKGGEGDNFWVIDTKVFQDFLPGLYTWNAKKVIWIYVFLHNSRTDCGIILIFHTTWEGTIRLTIV